MRIKSKTLKALIPILRSLPKKRKIGLISLIPLAVLSGVADFLVVGIIAQLFSAIVGDESTTVLPNFLSGILPEDSESLALSLVFLFIFITWISSSLKIILRAMNIRLKTNIRKDLSETAQRKMMSQSYEYFIGRDTTNQGNLDASVLINISRVTEDLVQPLLQMTSGLVVIAFLSSAIFVVGKKLAAILIFSLIASFFLITFAITPYLRYAAKERLKLDLQRNGILRESMRNILNIQLTNKEKYFQSKYAELGAAGVPIIWKGEVLPEIPRALIEPLGITLIFLFGLFPILSNPGTKQIIEIIPYLATVAITSLKLTVPLQETFRAITSIRACLPNLEETLKLVDLKIQRFTLDSPGALQKDQLTILKKVELQHTSYKYPTSKKMIIKDISLSIPIGSRVAFVGRTGSGKSTTANILLGLLRPHKGFIKVDDIEIEDYMIPAWQANCSYVPQQINLLGSSIAENIAFGEKIKNIDEDRLWEALRGSQLEEFVRNMPKQLKTIVGENGTRLSGGQRQRLAIARAFYQRAKFLVLDEATSSLDNKTEQDLMSAVDLISNDCTVVIIAHRLSTIMNSDCIYEFENGGIKAYGTFEELQSSSDSFKKMTLLKKRNFKSNQY